jgi:IS5 family transposase
VTTPTRNRLHIYRHRGKKTRLSELEVRTLKRRHAIEPVIGHLKSDHRMGRCHLKGVLGDKLHAVLCAAGFNIRRLLRMITKKGLRASLRALRAMAPTTVRSNQRLTFGWHVARMRLRHHHERPSYAIAAGWNR